MSGLRDKNDFCSRVGEKGLFMSSKSWKDVMKNQDRQAESMQNLSSDSDSLAGRE